MVVPLHSPSMIRSSITSSMEITLIAVKGTIIVASEPPETGKCLMVM